MIDHLVMYNATVRGLPFWEQCRAAELANCSEITVSPFDYRKHGAAGLGPAEMLKIAADHGVMITHLDPHVRWTPISDPTDKYGPIDPAFIDFDEQSIFAIAEDLGCRSFTALGTYPKDTYGRSEEVDMFGALCERAAARGFQVTLEFIPFLGIDTLEAAWDIVREAGAANSSIMFDMWHHRRSGSSDAYLRTIPGEKIGGVQLNDGSAALAPGVTLVEDCMLRRRPPGQGAFRVRDTVAALRSIGGLNNVGPEIFSAEFDMLAAEEIAARCRESIAFVLD